ncbi:MAG: hypothetical protein DRP74_03215 [Candidatus Omnitrophota bacterium]|nr:MAG: hypothetical protein DRP74_03215 [Candidatus Omnitrophota bacterium]
MEKRKERRIKVNLPIEISYGKSPPLTGETENLSRLGAYLEADRKFPLGVDIDINIEIPSYSDNRSLAGKVNCKGNVFRCSLTKDLENIKYYGIGVFFTEFSKESDKEKLSKYIDYLIEKEEESIKEGLKHWKEKRESAKITKKERQEEFPKEDAQQETLRLLSEVLKRLEEIKHLIKSYSKKE